LEKLVGKKRTRIDRVPVELIAERDDIKEMFDIDSNQEGWRKCAKIIKESKGKVKKKLEFDKNWEWG
jgi:hypothetical protein